MESLHRSMLIGVSIGMVVTTILILGLYDISCNRQIEMAKLGYEQVQTIGRGDYVWQKVK